MATVMRASYGRLLAILASSGSDIIAAEDALSDAFAKALIHWPKDMPRNPEAWLLTVARNRLKDIYRKEQRIEFHDDVPEPEHVDATIETIPDDRLKLMFVCAHPAIDPRIRTPLMLQTVVGLDSETIARAFLLPPATMAKRLVRAKNKIKASAVAFRVPEPEELDQRVSAVLEAIYGTFSRDWLAENTLAEEAFFLATLLADLLPNNAEVLGLAAVIAFMLSRREARVKGGKFVPLEEQDPAQWDHAMMQKASGYLAKAQSIGPLGRFQLEAAVHAVHADRLNTGIINWDALAQLYKGLSHVAPTIGTTVSYASALGRVAGPEGGLAALRKIDSKVRASFAPAQVVEAHFLALLGRTEEAASAYDLAIALTVEAPLRAYLATKRDALDPKFH
ncbi:MAG: DUF6596 domain-containing protein [Pseudomonadota bacterium]